MTPPTQAHVKEFLDYDPETGLFHWRARADEGRVNRVFNARFAGKEAGPNAYDSHGYKQIKLMGVNYLAHRLAYLWMTGIWADELDHADRDPRNNRFANLREATRSQNCANRRPTSKTGLRGITMERGKFVAHAGPRAALGRYLGSFDTAEEAQAAYEAGARKHYGEFILGDLAA